jgi:hypothetical protein
MDKKQKRGASLGKQETYQTNENNDDLNDVKNELNIPHKLREIIDDNDDNYKVPFEKPNELMDIFENLEEKNLFLIQ